MYLNRFLGLSFAWLLSSQALFAQQDQFSPLRTNQFLWGQVTGCVVRFLEYSRQTVAEGTMTEDQLLPFLTAHVGDLEAHLSTLLVIGRENGGIAGKMDEETWVGLISEFASTEYQDGSAWVQSFGCYKMLRDYGFAS